MNAALYALPTDHIKAFLLHAGWNIVNTNDRCFVFEGHADIDDKPFEIVLPINESAPDYPIYVEHTVRILSALADKSPDIVTNDILHFNRDLLLIRMNETSIDYSAKQVPRIKSLIRHSANSERNVKPHFNPSLYSKAAREMVDHFRLCHTHNGRSHYHVESEVGEKQPYQNLLFRDNLDPGTKLPLQRRVMERIATGPIDS